MFARNRRHARERERTVLDHHSCLMFISSICSGSQHDSSKVPLLLVGGLNGQLETGRVLDSEEKGMTTESSAACICR